MIYFNVKPLDKKPNPNVKSLLIKKICLHFFADKVSAKACITCSLDKRQKNNLPTFSVDNFVHKFIRPSTQAISNYWLKILQLRLIVKNIRVKIGSRQSMSLKNSCRGINHLGWAASIDLKVMQFRMVTDNGFMYQASFTLPT